MDSTHRGNSKEIHQRFLNLIFTLLKHDGYKNIQEAPHVRDAGVDFEAVAPNNQKVIGEIKLYRSTNVPLMSLNLAVRKLMSSATPFKARQAILITNAAPPDSFRESVDFEDSLIKIWGYEQLLNKFKPHPELSERLDEILRELHLFREKPPEQIELNGVIHSELGKVKTISMRDMASRESKETLSISDNVKIVKNNQRQVPKFEEKAPETRGTDIANSFDSIQPGGGDEAKQFELKCTEAVKYLFHDNLVSWREQENTDSRLHIYDLIARILPPEHDFWLTLQNHFRARYVIFEFKNYTDEISQREVYSTEKYLYLPAMRTVAIIISREGPSKNALHAARGALREHGKVIINLSLANLKEMLMNYDGGAIPSEYMADILDDMLMQVER